MTGAPLTPMPSGKRRLPGTPPLVMECEFADTSNEPPVGLAGRSFCFCSWVGTMDCCLGAAAWEMARLSFAGIFSFAMLVPETRPKTPIRTVAVASSISTGMEEKPTSRLNASLRKFT